VKLCVIRAAAILSMVIVALMGAHLVADSEGTPQQPAGKKADHLKMALVNIKSLYSDGPDACRRRPRWRGRR